MVNTIGQHRELYSKRELKQEKEANYFARCLLMPRALFVEFVDNQSHLNKSIIKDIAKKFQVPPEQVVVRLIELGYEIG